MAWSDPRTWANGEIPTETIFNAHVRDQFREVWHEVAYFEFAGDVAIGAGTEAAPVDVVSSGAIVFAAYPIIVEFYTPLLDLSAGITGTVSLWDATSDLGRLWAATGDNTSGAGDNGVHAVRRLTPSAASHTYKIRGWASGGATVKAGTGGAGTYTPGFIRIMQKGGP